MWVQSLGWEDPLQEGMETHSSILAWRIPMDRGAWWATVHGVAKSRTQLRDEAQQRQRSSTATLLLPRQLPSQPGRGFRESPSWTL